MKGTRKVQCVGPAVSIKKRREVMIRQLGLWEPSPFYRFVSLPVNRVYRPSGLL
jgi:hypothetical protein